MEIINKYKIIGLLLLLLVVAPACNEDFLERPPVDQIVDANFFKDDDQVIASTGLLYNRVWFEYNDKASYSLGDYKSGTATRYYNDRDVIEYTISGVAGHVTNSWGSFYIVVGQSNTVIANINRYASDEVTPSVKAMAIAEARYMRAMAYRYLVMNFGPVPIIENNLEQLTDTTITRNTEESVWRYITQEFRAAARDLPEVSVQPGRLNSWSAEAALARTYLTRAGVAGGGTKNQSFLDSAMYYSDRVIQMSGAQLLPEYADLFKWPYDNNPESLFSLQWVYSGPNSWGSQNSISSYHNFSNDIANGDGWGGDVTATSWILGLYEGLKTTGSTDDTRLHATFMMPGSTYPEITQSTTNDDGDPIDQELEVPFDEGATSNFASIKKYVNGKAIDQGGEAAAQRYGHDTYMLRLADMYLIYAEAAMGNDMSTNDATALTYFNEVRRRAGLDDVVGALTFMELLEERAVEFAMEATFWYDIVRLHYYNPDLAYTILSNQDKGELLITPDETPNPSSWTFEEVGDLTRNFTVNSGNFFLPYPTSELSTAPNLKKDPVDFFAGQ